MLFKVLYVLRINETRETDVSQLDSVDPRSKNGVRLPLVTIIALSLEAFMFWTGCYCKTTISAYLSPKTIQFAFILEGHLILKTFLTQEPPVAFSTIL